MSEIWSKNKLINSAVNVLLFLTAINVMHFGQLVLPVICLLIFIDRKFSFRVNSWFNFILLCLFGISFFAFSYSMGFYSVMGFCLPMAYYIGSNVLEPSEEKNRRILYLIALAMATHLFMNFVYDLMIHGSRIAITTGHYDIWTRGKVRATITASNIVFLMSSLYYLLFTEKNRKLQCAGMALFVIDFIYCMLMGRRTTALLFVIVLFVPFVLERFIFKTKSLKIGKAPLIVLATMVFFVLFVFVTYKYNLFNLYHFYNSNFYIIVKFMENSLEFERISLLFQSIGLRSSYLWGGQHISEIMGMQIHNLWGDIYDYAGIIPYILMIAFSVVILIKTVRVLLKKDIQKSYKILLCPVFFSIVIQMLIEPVMTSSSLFLIICIILLAINERLLSDGK